MRLTHYPYCSHRPFGQHGLLLAIPASLALWALIIATVF